MRNLFHKHLWVCIGFAFFWSCESNRSTIVSSYKEHQVVKKIEIPNIEIHDSLTQLNRNTGILSVKGQPFSGYVLDYYSPNQLKYKSAYFEGKRYGMREQWYPNGQLQSIAHYTDGILSETSRSWWQNGHPKTYNEYEKGQLHGTTKQWYKEGMIFKQLTYVGGKEVGLQQAWRQNGTLYANYIVKEGRIYGLKRANLCNGVKELEAR